MSVVAVKITSKKITISADNQISGYGHKFTDGELSNLPAKLFVSGSLIFGTAGYTSNAALFRLFCETRKPETNTSMGILNFLSEFSDWARKKDGRFELYNNFIIIFDKKVYRTNNYEVNEIDSYTAIGSGMYLALGAMYMGADTRKAIDVAKKYDLYCGGETQTIEVRL